MYGSNLGGSLIQSINNNLFKLFDYYVAMYGQSEFTSQSPVVGQTGSIFASSISVKHVSVLKARFKKHKMECGYGGSKRKNFEIYLIEA